MCDQELLASSPAPKTTKIAITTSKNLIPHTSIDHLSMGYVAIWGPRNNENGIAYQRKLHSPEGAITTD
jgi:hypothetical protein